MTRGTALVATVARVVQLTGVQDLANLEADSELTLTDLLIEASDAIYDQVEANGTDPTALTNQEVFERAVAWHFLALLTIGGYLPTPDSLGAPQDEGGRADPFAWSDPYFNRVRPKVASGESARRPGEGLPVVGNLRRRSAFDSSASTAGQFWDDVPRRR